MPCAIWATELGRRAREHHLAVGGAAERLQELDRVDVLVDEPVGAHEQRARDRRGVGVGAAPEDRVAREALAERPDQPEGVVLAAEPQPDQHDDAVAPDTADDLQALVGGAGLGEHLHVGAIVDQQRRPARTTGSGSTTTTPSAATLFSGLVRGCATLIHPVVPDRRRVMPPLSAGSRRGLSEPL